MILFFDRFDHAILGVHVEHGEDYERSVDNKASMDEQSLILGADISDLVNVGERKYISDNIEAVNTIKDTPLHNKDESYLSYDSQSDEIEVKARELLEITTDAQDTSDPYDGIPDIPADGTSQCTLYIKVKNKSGDYLQLNTETILESTRGRLSSLKVNLTNGVGEVSLLSAKETCVSTITASASRIIPGDIKIQFSPV